ncbi:unnamed protein product [Protopolystoma xenopodis]|uniref:Uncharacterized protein n=1 Tax=Protopolystoma xenopodis TaxID=117903 RepID=A0A3S5C7X2_9PLAT|nr:unnamed protein product [Protopolystoma xenopodis]
MARLTNDAVYDAGETSENVPSPRSDARNYDSYYGRGLWTKCFQISLPDNKTKSRQRGKPTFRNRKETTNIPESTLSLYLVYSIIYLSFFLIKCKTLSPMFPKLLGLREWKQIYYILK